VIYTRHCLCAVSSSLVHPSLGRFWGGRGWTWGLQDCSVVKGMCR